jgi:8-oxo-dGTP pyrophosphatase MutT (NUDIX family)
MLRPASTVCLLRDRPGGFEVLMVRRASASKFVGGAYVFPGGALDEEDGGDLAHRAVSGVDDPEMLPWVAAAVREAAEESGVLLLSSDPIDQDFVGLHGTDLYQAVIDAGITFDGGRLAYLSNWVTPEGEPRRFDTRFFLAEVPGDTEARPDEYEVTDAVWTLPRQALEQAKHRAWFMLPPTILTLRTLDRFDKASEAVEFAGTQPEIPRIEPKLVVAEDGAVRVLMPGQAGYDDPKPL